MKPVTQPNDLGEILYSPFLSGNDEIDRQRERKREKEQKREVEKEREKKRGKKREREKKRQTGKWDLHFK